MRGTMRANRASLVVASCFASILSGCALAGGDDESFEQAVQRAGISLVSSNARLTQTSDTEWSLDKTGTVNTSSKTVQWTVTATRGTTTSGLLIVNGVMKVKNSGQGGATIGNIIVNLQTKVANRWVTVSTNVADATDDDAATSANIVSSASSEGRSTFTENSASGQLLFTDATTNSMFALVPQVTIAPGSTVNLLFSATFDNNVLNLAVGKQTRAEIIVTFGNSGPSGASAQNIDIDGSGTIDPDEDWVRSVPARVNATVPAPQGSNGNVTLSDTVQDISTTGTVTFSNPSIVLGSTSGTVTVSYNGGLLGGTITNCAHLTGTGQNVTSGGFNFPNVAGVDLEACDTQVIGPHACTAGTAGCGWEQGDLITYTPSVWGDPASTAGQLLNSRFSSVYFANGGILEVGISGVTGFSMSFTSANAVLAYEPAIGPAGALNADLVDPVTTASGVFGGEVVALALNVDFSDAGLLAGTAQNGFGDLTLCGLSVTGLNGISVRDFLAISETALGGGSTPYTIAELQSVAEQLNAAFSGGAPSSFAQDHLFSGACPL